MENRQPQIGDVLPHFGDASDLHLLKQAEFGNRIELAIRFAVIIAGSVALYLYTGLWHGPAWAAAYGTSQAVTYVALSRARPPYRRVDYVFGAGGYLLTSMIFLMMPIGLFMFADPALAFCGGMVLVALCVFSLWREEIPAAIIPYDIAMACITAALVLWSAWPEPGNIIGQVMAVVLTVTVLSYYSLALIGMHRTREALKSAAARGLEAQKMEAIGRLSGGIAHDFNNILTVLQGNLELYHEVDDPTERARLVREAREAGNRASGLVSQLLSFARRAPLSPTRIAAADMIQDMADMSARLLPARIAIYPAIPVRRLCTVADQSQLTAAMLNLILNARDAMPNGGEITLSATPTTLAARDSRLRLAPGRYVQFTVSDTGSGMTPEIAEKAVEPFFSTKPAGAGSGLGLSMANGFAEQSGGSLVIESSDTGTSVSIYLPRGRGLNETESAARPVPVAEAELNERDSLT